VDRRRLVDAPRDRLEVADVEDVRPQVAVPANDVERVVPVVVGGDPVADLDVDDEFVGLGARLEELGRPDVALAVRRVLEELPVVVPVALRRLQLRGGLEPKHPLGAALVGLEPPGRPDWAHEVVPRAVAEAPEHRVPGARSLVDKDHLVGLAVPVERVLRHRLIWTGDAHHDVRVEEQRNAAGDRVALRCEILRVDQSVAMGIVVGFVELDPSDGLHLVRPGRRHEVIEKRASAREAFDPEQLLGVERAVGRAMLGVALVGHIAERQVEHRGAPPGAEDQSRAGRAR